MKRLSGILIIAMSLSACASHAPPAAVSADPSPRVHFENAKTGNWQLRAYTKDSTYEGRVAFVQATSAGLAGVTIQFQDVTRVERSIKTDQGGKLGGILLGGAIGVLLGAAAISFHEYGSERDCDAICSARIMIPTMGAIAIIGGLVGGAIRPSTREWSTVWERP